VKPKNECGVEWMTGRLYLKNLPLPLFAKEGYYSSLWKREVRRDFITNVFIFMTLLITTQILVIRKMR
jgi:hypothetical protein